jgi:hypothetical protein
MNTPHPNEPTDLPLGSDPTRSRTPLIIWAVLFLLALLFLIAMAAFYPARA